MCTDGSMFFENRNTAKLTACLHVYMYTVVGYPNVLCRQTRAACEKCMVIMNRNCLTGWYTWCVRVIFFTCPFTQVTHNTSAQSVAGAISFKSAYTADEPFDDGLFTCMCTGQCLFNQNTELCRVSMRCIDVNFGCAKIWYPGVCMGLFAPSHNDAQHQYTVSRRGDIFEIDIQQTNTSTEACLHARGNVS